MQSSYYPRPRRLNQTNQFIDAWLPWGLIVLFYGPAIAFMFYATFTGPAPFMSFLSLALMFVLFIYVVLPIAGTGLRLGLRTQNAELIEDARFKIIAAYSPTPVAMTLGVSLLTGAAARVVEPGLWGMLAVVGSALIGTVAGFSVSFFLMWLLFHLRFGEAMVGWIFTSIFYFLGTLAAMGMLITIMLPFAFVMGYSSGGHIVAADPTPPAPASYPPADTKARPVDPLITRSARDVGLREPGTPLQTDRRPTPQLVPAPYVPPPAPPARQFTQSPARPSVAYVPPTAVNANVPPVYVPPVAPEPRNLDPVAQFRSQKSLLVANVSGVDFNGQAKQILHARAHSPLVAAVKGDDPSLDVVEVWDVTAKQKRGETSFPREAGVEANLALSPDGASLARIVHFPKLAVQVVPLKPGAQKTSIPLNERLGTPALEGFLTADRIAIHWKRGSDEGFEILETAKGKSVKQLPVQQVRQSNGNGVISPDGRYYILAAAPPRARPQMQVYELLGPRGGARWVPLNVDSGFAEEPAGMAFSPDSKKFAALYERNGQATIFSWILTNGALVKPREIAVPVPVRAGQRAKHRSLDWINGGTAWLVMGNQVIDSETGEVKGSLNAPESAEQWPIDDTTLAYRFEALGKSLFATVTLDAAKTAGTTPR